MSSVLHSSSLPRLSGTKYSRPRGGLRFHLIYVQCEARKTKGFGIRLQRKVLEFFIQFLPYIQLLPLSCSLTGFSSQPRSIHFPAARRQHLGKQILYSAGQNSCAFLDLQGHCRCPSRSCCNEIARNRTTVRYSALVTARLDQVCLNVLRTM